MLVAFGLDGVCMNTTKASENIEKIKFYLNQYSNLDCHPSKYQRNGLDVFKGIAFLKIDCIAYLIWNMAETGESSEFSLINKMSWSKL